MESFDIHLDQENELAFNITVEGTDEAELKYQLVLESEKMNYSFLGEVDETGEISFVIPPLQKMLTEGSYNTRLEVVVDDRIFVPLSMQANAKKQIKVVAEARVRHKKGTPKVTASVATSARKRPEVKATAPKKPVITESKHIEIENLSQDQVRKLARLIAEKRITKKNKE